MTLILIFFVSTFGMNFQVTNALMSRGVFHTGAGAFGLASTVFAVGALGGALIAARRSRPTLTLLVATALAFSVFEVLSGLMPDFLTFMLMLVPDRPGAADADHRGQLDDAARHDRRDAGPGDGAVHAGVPRRHAARLAAGRVGGRGLRRRGWSSSPAALISLAATVAVGLALARRGGVPARSYLRPARLARADP